MAFKVYIFKFSLFVIEKHRPIGHAPLTNPQRTNTAHCITYYANIILHIMPASYLICSLVFVAFEDSHSLPRRPMPYALVFVGA